MPTRVVHLGPSMLLGIALGACSDPAADPAAPGSVVATSAGGTNTAAGSTMGATSTTSADETTASSTNSTTGAVATSGAGGAASTVSTQGSTTLAVTSTGGAGTSASGGATGTTSMGGGGTGSTCEDGKVVHFVYFVEADAEYSESQHADIEAQAYAFQQYWFQQLGVTFYLNEPVVDVIEADHESGWYLTTPDGIHSDERWYRLGNVKTEVFEKLGISDFDTNHRVVNYPTTRHDGRVGGNFGGAWMDGDDLSCMAEPDGVNYPYDDGGPAHCLGHVVHEFGHVLGLDHEGPDTDCMQYGFYVSSTGGEMCTLSSDNVAKILANPNNAGWLDAQPGQTCRG